MSFKSNRGKPIVEAGPEQCQMIDASGRNDVACLEPCVGEVPDNGDVRVCGACAVQMEREDFIVSYREETRFVLVHSRLGIFLGTAEGHHLWSKVDVAVASPAAVTFENRTQADYAMEAWPCGRPEGITIWPVMPDRGALHGDAPTFASPAACAAAGLEAWGPEAAPTT